LAPQAHERLRREIDQLVLKEAYRPTGIDQPDIGYVFCPEHRAGRPEPLYVAGGEAARLWLFDPSLLPEERAARMTGSTLDERRTADRLKAFEKYTAIFFGEGRQRPTSVLLAS
jgi:hypothetical protein